MKSDFIQISDQLFIQLGKRITERYGIKMPLEKKVMFQARLQRRLRELNIQSFDEYALKLLDPEKGIDEFSIMADFISTNKTEFFRENDHFNFLRSHVLPQLMSHKKSSEPALLNVWSAGCSSGQEAYSVAITIEEFVKSSPFRLGYEIIATDISGRMLRMAKDAIYPMSQVDQVPHSIKQHYFLKSKNVNDPKVRVIREIRDKVKLGYLNLMDSSYPFDVKFDVVFLRNTLIYFDHQVQMGVLTKVIETLNPGGYLFVGHSESLINMYLPILSVAPSVYIKTNN
jgi:chemotaxis protein methyltransferase CheR